MTERAAEVEPSVKWNNKRKANTVFAHRKLRKEHQIFLMLPHLQPFAELLNQASTHSAAACLVINIFDNDYKGVTSNLCFNFFGNSSVG